MKYNIDFYQDIDYKFSETDFGTHILTMLRKNEIEGYDGHVFGWVHNFDLKNKTTKQRITKSYVQDEEESAYHTFVKAYKEACREINVEPENWQ